MSGDLDALRDRWKQALWPVERLASALGAAHATDGPATGTHPVVVDSVLAPLGHGALTRERLGQDLEWHAQHMGLQATPIEATVPEVEAALARCGPCVVAIAYPDGFRLAAIQGCRRGQLQLVTPDHGRVRMPVGTLYQLLCGQLEAGVEPVFAPLLSRTGLAGEQGRRTLKALAHQRLQNERIHLGWHLQAAPAASLGGQLWRSQLPLRLLVLWGILFGIVGLEIEGWRVMGGALLDNRVDTGTLSTWVLMLLTGLVLSLAAGLLQNRLMLDLARDLKKRLLLGTLSLNLNELRKRGHGRWLGTVLESQALESTLLNGGLGTLMAAAEWVLAAWVLSHTPSAPLHMAWLLLWTAGVAGVAWRALVRQDHWTQKRLQATHRMIERMVGHRTVVAQEKARARHLEEDAMLKSYHQASVAMDRSSAWLDSAAPQLWMVGGLLCMWPAYAEGGLSVTSLGIALGGLMLANRALSALASGGLALGRAVQVLNRCRMLLQHQPAQPGHLPPQAVPTPTEAGDRLLQGAQLQLAWPGRPEPVFRDVHLRVDRGDLVLLQGDSGSGKSSLAAVLTGQQAPSQGVLLLHGLDLASLGTQWAQRVVSAPQFHQNHLFAGSLAHNLLLGREGVAGTAELAEAEAVCRELGLGGLIDRMPGGLLQVVGETGWQLSHGERSRVFLARALLQGAELVVLDESFAALDPDTLGQCLACAMRRAPSLVVIAHP